MTVDDLADLVEASFAGTSAPPASPDRDLSEADARHLVDMGVDVSPLREGEPDAALAGAGKYLAMLAAGETVAEAAARLGVSGSRVRQMLAERALCGVRDGARGWRIPSWQFVGARTVPGIAEAIKALDPRLPPLSVQGFFSTTQPELADRTPLEWLNSGGDPAAVVALAADL